MYDSAQHLLCLFLQKMKNKQETWGEGNQSPELAGLPAVAITDFTIHGHNLLHHPGWPHGLSLHEVRLHRQYQYLNYPHKSFNPETMAQA